MGKVGGKTGRGGEGRDREENGEGQGERAMGRDRGRGRSGGGRSRKVNGQNFMLLKHPFEAPLPNVHGLRLRLLPSKEESIEYKIIPQFEV